RARICTAHARARASREPCRGFERLCERQCVHGDVQVRHGRAAQPVPDAAMKRSAGLLMFRRGADGAVEVLLAHPGGPFWRARDAGAWSLPKGEWEPPEEPLAAALREWQEETGFPASPPFAPLGEVTQKGGKHVLAWAFEGDFEPARLRSNTFELEW